MVQPYNTIKRIMTTTMQTLPTACPLEQSAKEQLQCTMDQEKILCPIWKWEHFLLGITKELAKHLDVEQYWKQKCGGAVTGMFIHASNLGEQIWPLNLDSNRIWISYPSQFHRVTKKYDNAFYLDLCI